MTDFAETIKRVTGVEVEEDRAEGFAYLCVQVVTRGNIKKTIRIPHYWAALLRNSLEMEIADMEDTYRRASWWESAPGTDERKTQVIGPKPGSIVEEKAA